MQQNKNIQEFGDGPGEESQHVLMHRAQTSSQQSALLKGQSCFTATFCSFLQKFRHEVFRAGLMVGPWSSGTDL